LLLVVINIKIMILNQEPGTRNQEHELKELT